MKHRCVVLVAAACFAIAPIGAGYAQSWSDLVLVNIADGFDRPVAVRHAGDGSGRLFIVEQAGVIKILANGAVLPTPFLDIRTLVKSGGEQGLLGLDFHPDYSTNGYFYVNYTRSNGTGNLDRTVIARYTVSPDPNQADPGSALVIMEIEQDFSNHNGGDIHFGADGYLYIGMGDGGSGGDPNNRAQTLNSLLGKLLRIDVNNPPQTPTDTFCGLNASGYNIPADNPLLGNAGACPEIWSWGLRNPWRWSFDRETNDLFIGDVGQSQREEIDFQVASSAGGENYGWSCMEGNTVQNFNVCLPDQLTSPIIDYDHSLGCSVTGGYRYRGSRIGALQGVYVYGDFCSGRIWFAVQTEDGWSSTLWRDTDISISSFGEDENGELYVADLSGGAIYRLDSPIVVSIEEPAANTTMSGVANFRGFATTPFEDCPIDRVELFIDGEPRGTIPIGGSRVDVCEVFNHPDCAVSGFSQAINYSNFDAVAHSARVRAVDCLGNFTETSVFFNTNRFATPFISDSNAVNMLSTSISIDPGDAGLDKRIFLQSVFADGQCYDVTLDYATEIQGWKIVAIQEVPSEDCF